MKEDFTRVTEIMTKDVIHTIPEELSAAEAAKQMKSVQRGSLIVVKGSRPIGIVTERDLVQRVLAEGIPASNIKISQVMSHPLISIGPEALVTDAARIMSEHRIRRLPVMDGTVLVGIVTVTDFAKCLWRKSSSDPMLAAMSRAAQELWQTA
jgi:CBS domain-containing protein